MAHGWDSYYHNLPPLSSDPSTLRRTSESEGKLSQHIENFIGHHDFPGTVASHEAPAANSNFNTNYYPNHNIGNSSSDCVYQRYYKDAPWQTDGEQMEQDYLPRCGNGDMDFATDGLSTSESFPSSFATDLQELKQDCGTLAASFLEDYSDVSSCSDADVCETRPSCKFMATNSVQKPKTDVTAKPSSSEWLFTNTGNMTIPTESQSPNISEIHVNLPSPSNVRAGENIAECAQDKMESPENTVTSYTGHNQSSTTSNMVTTTRRVTVKDRNDNNGCQEQKQKEDVKRELTQGKYSNILISGHQNMSGDGIGKYPDGKEEITTTAPSILTTFDNEQDHLHEKVLREEINESFDQENGGLDNPSSTDGKDISMGEEEQDKCEVLKEERKDSGSLENENFNKQKPPNLNSTDGQDEHLEIDHQEEKNLSNTSQSLDPPGIKESDCKDATNELRECTSTLKNNSQDVKLCSQLSEHESYESATQDNKPLRPAVMSDGLFSDTSDTIEQSVASHSKSCLETNSFRTDGNPSLEKEMTSAPKKKNTSSTHSDCSSPVMTSDIKEQNPNRNSELCLQLNTSSTDINPCLEKEMTSPPEKKTTTSPPDSDCSSTVVTSDNKEQSVNHTSESCLHSNTSSTDMNSCQEKEWTNPAENTNTASTLDQHQSLHQSQMALQPESLSGDVAENARESFEELDTSTEEPLVLGMLYGEPLSREDSSCDTNETKHDTSPYKGTSLCPDGYSTNHSEGQAPQLKSSIQMRKRLQPVVIVKTSESVNGMSNSYHCAGCKHITHNVDHLIEHHHCCHSVPSFQFCKTCNLYLMRTEQGGKHLCGVTKESSQLPPNPSLQSKRKRIGRHKCISCGLIFSKIVLYIKHMRTHTGETPYKCNGCGSFFAQGGSLRRHMRIPGRCKQQKPTVTDSDAVTSETKTPPQEKMKEELKQASTASQGTTSLADALEGRILLSQEKPPQKDSVQIESPVNLPECYVRLVDISNISLCKVCGKRFSTAKKTKKHYYNAHRGKNLAVWPSPCPTKPSVEKSQKVENEKRPEYKCPLCPRLFKYSYNRARHLRDCVRDSVFGGKQKINGRYRCPLCDTTFSLPSNRYRHIKGFCLREYLNRLAKEAKSRPKGQPKIQSKESDQKTLSKENEQKTPSKENEQKKQATSVLTALPVPCYKCSLCPAVFRHPSGKYRHMKKHELFKLTGKMFKYRKSVFSTLSKPETLSSTKTEDSKDNLKSTEENSSLDLSCHFCGKCFSTSQSLKKHERNHKGERPYRCLECGKGFKRRAYLIGHKIVHQRRIQCTVCRKILPTIGELIQHRHTHLKRGKLQCPDCHLQFQYPAHLLRHLDGHKKRENKALQERLQESPQLKPQQSLESVKEQGEPNQLQCSLCKEVFKDAQVLRKHCLTHISGSSSNQCPFCKRSFNNRRYLLRHMIIHTGDKPLSCTNCGKQFYRDLYLKLHSEKCLPAQTSHLVTKESKTNTKSLQCSYCPRVFSKKIRLKSHHRGHKTNSLLLCSRCGQYFGFRKLGQHQKNCEGTMSLMSPNGNFSKSTTQKNQNAQKTGLQSSTTKLLQFKCPYCTQRFRYRSLLSRHVVSHTGVQPYACVHCGHRYRSQTMCLQHEAFCDGVYKERKSKLKSDAAKQLSNMPALTETAQKPQAEGEAEYKCKFCTKTFMKPRNLRRHILTHNEVKPYRCKACDSCFSRYDHLKVHQARCKGKKSRLEVCIPKISLDDVGKGWQSKFDIEPAQKQETFECVVCARSFSTQSILTRHNTMFHVAKLFKCTRCGSSFAHEKNLRKHRKMRKCRNVSKESNASLPLATKPPTENVTKLLDGVRSRILQRIQPRFNKKYKYICSYCPRAFGTNWQLCVHTRLHTGEKPYACDYCGQRFIRKDYVQRHLQRCSAKSQQSKVLCDKCGQFFPQAKLENHKKRCTSTPSLSTSTVSQSKQSASPGPPKGFSCAYCSSRFLLFSQLQEHFLNAHKMETMVPPVSTAPLQHHLSNMPNIKEEPVDENCDEELSDDTNLICKLDTALEREIPQPFSCTECNMSFITKAGLTGHLRVHRTEPFNCKRCKRGFWNKTVLRNHYRKCRFGRISARSTTKQLEVPLKAELDFALNDSVLVFKEGSKTTGTGVLQTNFSCKEDSMDEFPQNSEGKTVQGSTSKEKKTVQYQCSECDKSFTDGLMLISHLEDHGRQEQEKKRNTCTKCGRVCTSQGHLEKHMRIHGANKKYSCPDCTKTFNTAADLESHRTCHEPNQPFVCKLCNQRFLTRPSLCNHYSEDHPDDVFTCRFCNKTYAAKKSLGRHIKKWHQKEQRAYERSVQEKTSTERQSSSQVSTNGESDEDENNGSEDSDSDSAPYFPCHVCGKTFPTSESLEDHQLCHLGEKPHECAECGRCFFQASQLQQHQRMHKSEFQCQACGRGFVSLFALRKHKHTHGKSRPYRCSKCHFSFTGPSQLAEHMSTHREENFPCDICNRVFLSKSSRAEHRKSHSRSGDQHSTSREEHKKSASLSESSSVFNKELKYRCGVCSERFKDPEKLSEHGCMAAKERPYSCADCNKHFLHASHLKKHRATHHPSWSSSEYPCNQCNNSFSTSQQFLSHLKSHVDTSGGMEGGGPPHGFICPVCHQCFASASELIEHFPTHPDGTFECKHCKMTFPSESKLEEHECHHVTSATEFECTDYGQSCPGSSTFHQHNCSHQQHAIMEDKYSNPSFKTSPSTYQAAGEDEEIDVTGEDLYYCPVCSMEFSSKSVLLEHQNKQHPNEKPFTCELCGKTFAMRRYLKQHMRRHRLKSASPDITEDTTDSQLAENELRCSQCDIDFNTEQDLSLHMRLHAEKEVGEYRCDMCYKSFSQWSLLKQHQESHVGQVVYECTECDKAFAFPHLLEEHQQTHAESSQ